MYWYSYASTPAEARQEARCCLAAIQGKHLCLPVAYDIEYEPCILRLTNAQRTALVEAFLGEVQDAGYYGILYASTDFIRNRLDWQALTCFDCWPAQYGSACTCPLPHGMWQYSSANALGVPGFGSHLDCNKVYKDYEQIMIQAGLQGHKTAEPDADTKPNALPLQKADHWPRIQRRCTDAVQAGAGAWAGGSRAVQGRADRRADHADLDHWACVERRRMAHYAQVRRVGAD